MGGPGSGPQKGGSKVKRWKSSQPKKKVKKWKNRAQEIRHEEKLRKKFNIK